MIHYLYKHLIHNKCLYYYNSIMLITTMQCYLFIYTTYKSCALGKFGIKFSILFENQYITYIII